MASRAVSRSRTSPTMITSGSWRTTCRNVVAKVSPFLAATWIWLMPANWYSIGSSTVRTFFSDELSRFRQAYSVVVLPLPVGPVTNRIPWLMLIRFSRLVRSSASRPSWSRS